MSNRVKKILVSGAWLVTGSALTLAYQWASLSHIEMIRKPKDNDSEYLTARLAMIKENPDFERVFSGKIEAMILETQNFHCFFFYKKSGIIWEGGDLIYCFDRKTGRFLGAQK